MPTLTVSPESYTVSHQRHVLETRPSDGLFQQRDVWNDYFRRVVRTWSLSWELADLATVDAVTSMADTVNGVAGSFTYQPPGEVAGLEVRFVAEPEITAIAGGRYRMKLQVQEV